MALSVTDPTREVRNQGVVVAKEVKLSKIESNIEKSEKLIKSKNKKVFSIITAMYGTYMYGVRTNNTEFEK